MTITFRRIMVLFLLSGIPYYGFAGGEQTPRKPLPVQNINCEPLAPSRKPSTDVEAKVKAHVDGLFARLVSTGGDAALKWTEKDLLVNIPNADRVLVAQATAYLICESMKQSPEQASELIFAFSRNVLPTFGFDNKTGAVLQSKSFPRKGTIKISPNNSASFENGSILIETQRDSVPSDSSSSEVGKTAKSKAKMAPAIILSISYAERTLGIQNVSTPFSINDKKKFSFGRHKFYLTYIEYYDGTDEYEFLVEKLN